MRLARNAADIVGHGFEGMKDSASDREKQKGGPGAANRSNPLHDPHFLKCDSHAVPWEWIRKKVEDRCGYTIQDIEAKEIAYHAQNYGVEVLGTLGISTGKDENGTDIVRLGIDQGLAMRHTYSFFFSIVYF